MTPTILNMSDRHQTKPYPLRLPDDLRERLESVAKLEGRSLNAEIAQRLEASFNAPGTESGHLLLRVESKDDMLMDDLMEYVRTIQKETGRCFDKISIDMRPWDEANDAKIEKAKPIASRKAAKPK